MRHSHQGYNSGHPWYYLLGGKRLTLKEIRQDVRASGYRGYLERDIDAADRLPEPKRSDALRAIRKRVTKSIAQDIARYREVARKLASHRAEGLDVEPFRGAADIHTAISLKHNHIYNEFAHLHVIDHLLNRQPDLFGDWL